MCREREREREILTVKVRNPVRPDAPAHAPLSIRTFADMHSPGPLLEVEGDASMNETRDQVI